MNTGRMFTVAVFLDCLGAIAGATEQQRDKLIYGGHEYAIYEVPMLGLWHYGEGDPPAGRKKPPAFDFVSSANWSGYTATWEIGNKTLLLRELRGRLEGKDEQNETILPEYKFPVKASWYSGRINLPIGDLDEETGEYESVVVFEVQKGIVRSIAFRETAKLPAEWNGLPASK